MIVSKFVVAAIGVLMSIVLSGCANIPQDNYNSSKTSSSVTYVAEEKVTKQQPLQQQAASKLQIIRLHCVQTNEPVKQDRGWVEMMQKGKKQWCDKADALVRIDDENGRSLTRAVTVYGDSLEVTVDPGKLFGKVTVYITADGRTERVRVPTGSTMHNVVFVVPDKEDRKKKK